MESNGAAYQKLLIGALGAMAVFACVSVAALAYILVRYLPEQQSIFESRLASAAALAAYDATTASTTESIASLSERLKATDTALAKAQATDAPRTLTALIQQWSALVPRLSCDFATADNLNQTGSGMLVNTGGSTMEIWTNKHVLSASGNTMTASNCTAYFLNGKSYYVSGDNFSVDTSTDFGYMRLAHPDVALLATAPAITTSNFCRTPASIGDQIVVLGYPSIGANSGITATEGIVSGIEGDYYVTSAKVEYGNSGGIAIDVRRNCYLGIPTFVESGQLESLARILRWQSYGQSAR